MICLDAIRIEIRENNQVLDHAVCLAVGVDLDGIKRVLGISGRAPRARRSGPTSARTTLIVCCDGPKGLPDAIETKVATALKPIHTAPSEDPACDHPHTQTS